MFTEIKPIFHINKYDISLINKINRLLNEIEVKEKVKLDSLKKNSKVRSIQSSLSIEANSLTLEDVSKIIENKPVVGRKEEIQEAKNILELYKNNDQYNYLNEKDFMKAHTLLMQCFNDDNGNYRNHGEAVSRGNKIIFMAPESTVVPNLMNSLFKYINDNKDSINLLVLSAIFHYYVVYIHPFTDGNGRIARFWMSLMLKDYNPSFEFIPFEEEIYLNQEEYYKAIQACHNNGNVNMFIRFILKSIVKCMEKIKEA